MADHYEALGIGKDASQADITRAYRKKAMRAHPDRKGGSAEEFHPIQRAYSVLSDPDKRKHYDETGSDPDTKTDEDRAIENLQTLLLSLIDQSDAPGMNLIETMRKIISEVMQKKREEIVGIKRKIKTRTRAMKQIKRKNGGKNLLVIVIETDIRNLDQSIARAEKDIRDAELMLSMLVDYEHEAPEQMQEVDIFSALGWAAKRAGY